MSYAKEKGVSSSQYIIFSDLDDTLLEHDSYKWEKAGPALEHCINCNIPVILISSKTRAEILTIHGAMGLDFPFVSENGGGIFFPLEYEKILRGRKFSISGGLIKFMLGMPYNELVVHLKAIKEETGLLLKGFSQMTSSEIMDLTGLSGAQCTQALEREFDEPFIVRGPEKGDAELLCSAAEKRGLKISEGGRFFHLHGKSDKGKATGWLISFYKEQYDDVFSIALGDSPNDYAMFDAVNQPVIIKSSRQLSDVKLKERYPGMIITDKYGPEGWNEAVMGLLKTKREVLSDV
jgi:mannosyl-3-phosphoglycerate phosphatase